MRQVAELFVAERIVAHVLQKRAAIGEGVRFPEVILGSGWKAMEKQRNEVIFPDEINDFLMGKNGIGVTRAYEGGEDSAQA